MKICVDAYSNSNSDIYFSCFLQLLEKYGYTLQGNAIPLNQTCSIICDVANRTFTYIKIGQPMPGVNTTFIRYAIPFDLADLEKVIELQVPFYTRNYVNGYRVKIGRTGIVQVGCTVIRPALFEEILKFAREGNKPKLQYDEYLFGAENSYYLLGFLKEIKLLGIDPVLTTEAILRNNSRILEIQITSSGRLRYSCWSSCPQQIPGRTRKLFNIHKNSKAIENVITQIKDAANAVMYVNDYTIVRKPDGSISFLGETVPPPKIDQIETIYLRIKQQLLKAKTRKKGKTATSSKKITK